MVTVDDVAAIVGQQLDSTTSFASAVPGGVYNGRGDDTPSGYPYATFTITAQPRESCFDDVYFQTFRIELAVYCPEGQSGVNDAAVQQALFQALAIESATATMQTASLRNAGERVMGVIQVAPSGEYSPTLRSARDVFVAGLAIEILCQGDRSVP